MFATTKEEFALRCGYHIRKVQVHGAIFDPHSLNRFSGRRHIVFEQVKFSELRKDVRFNRREIAYRNIPGFFSNF